MARTANSARLAGVDMNTLLGYLASVGEVTQREMSTVGEAFKTIFARYSNVKIGKLIDDNGESLNDFESVLRNIGVTLRDNVTGNFRAFDDVMGEVVEKYKKLDAQGVDVSGIAKALGGVRQKENVLVLLENYDKAMQYAETAATSAGTAMEKFGSYQEGLEAKSNRLTAAFEKMSNSLVSSGLIGLLLDTGTTALNIGASFGGVPATLAGVTAAFIALSTALKTLGSSSLGSNFIKTFTDLRRPETTGSIVRSHSKKVAESCYLQAQEWYLCFTRPVVVLKMRGLMSAGDDRTSLECFEETQRESAATLGIALMARVG